MSTAERTRRVRTPPTRAQRAVTLLIVMVNVALALVMLDINRSIHRTAEPLLDAAASACADALESKYLLPAASVRVEEWLETNDVTPLLGRFSVEGAPPGLASSLDDRFRCRVVGGPGELAVTGVWTVPAETTPA